MPPIEDQIVKDFVNGQLLDIAFILQRLKVKMDDAKLDYISFVQPVLAGYAEGDELLLDRGSIPNPLKSEIDNFLTLCNSLITTLGAESTPVDINKLCINPVI